MYRSPRSTISYIVVGSHTETAPTDFQHRDAPIPLASETVRAFERVSFTNKRTPSKAAWAGSMVHDRTAPTTTSHCRDPARLIEVTRIELRAEKVSRGSPCSYRCRAGIGHQRFAPALDEGPVRNWAWRCMAVSRNPLRTPRARRTQAQCSSLTVAQRGSVRAEQSSPCVDVRTTHPGDQGSRAGSGCRAAGAITASAGAGRSDEGIAVGRSRELPSLLRPCRHRRPWMRARRRCWARQLGSSGLPRRPNRDVLQLAPKFRNETRDQPQTQQRLAASRLLGRFDDSHAMESTS